MKENIFKVALTAAGTALSAYLGNLLIPIFILIAVMIFDYISSRTANSYSDSQELDKTQK